MNQGNERTTSMSKTKGLVQMAIFAALIVVLAFTPFIGYIPLGFTRATIICGNAADHDLLIEEGIEQADALVSLTGMDEENIILALFAKTKGVDKIVAKVNEDGRAQLVEELGIDLIVSAKTATADAIMSYVRARQNSLKNVNVESMYQLVGGRVEALEFIIKEKTEYTDIPFKDLEQFEQYIEESV